VLDKWTLFDNLNAFLNMAAVYLIKNVTPRVYLSENPYPLFKDGIDYFMIMVLCVSWMRFFLYFLVIRKISKLLLTLTSMIKDTMYFMLIVFCFILIMTSVFTTLYQDTNPQLYGSMTITVRTLYDASLAIISYEKMENRILSYSVLIIFYVFMANILLMNFLIAILTTTYEQMKEKGVFFYKVNLFQYCERFLPAFNNRAYGEFTLHPPPLTYLVFPFSFFMLSKRTVDCLTTFFALFMHWIENILVLLVFLFYSVMLTPFTFLKTFYHFSKFTKGFFRIFMFALWAVIGFPMSMFLVLRDVGYMIGMMSFHQGCKYGIMDEKVDTELPDEVKLYVINEIRCSVINIFKTI